MVPHRPWASGLNNLARLLEAQGDLAAARPLYERALAILEKALGPEHPSTNRVHCHLAHLLITSGHAREALGPAETALRAHEKILGPNNSWTKDTARVTAETLRRIGEHELVGTLNGVAAVCEIFARGHCWAGSGIRDPGSGTTQRSGS